MNRLHQAIQQANGKPVLGAALYFYDPIFLEIAAHMGFKVIWIEMEHAAITFAQAGDLCRMAAGSGLLTMIRIPDARRETILKAAECGPDIIDLPMANSPQDFADLVRYAKYFPEGERGLWSGSRALKYGIVESMSAAIGKVNADIALLAQIETVEALDRIDQLAAIPNVDIFIGPADLSSSMGIPWQTDHPRVLEAAARIMSVAHSHGKKVATACGPADFIHWSRLGIDLLFCTNDIACLKMGAKLALKAAVDAIDQAAAEPKAQA
jgi:2-keto-3-deoxy-L-rhamnonate aldolase RhmA